MQHATYSHPFALTKGYAPPLKNSMQFCLKINFVQLIFDFGKVFRMLFYIAALCVSAPITTRLQTVGRIGSSIQPPPDFWLEEDGPSQRCKRSSGADYDLSSWRQGLWCVERELLGVSGKNMSYRAPPVGREAASQLPCRTFCELNSTDWNEADYEAPRAPKARTQAGKSAYHLRSECKEGMFYEMVSSIGLPAAPRLKVNSSFYEATERHQFGTHIVFQPQHRSILHYNEPNDPPESSHFHPRLQRQSRSQDGLLDKAQCGRNEYSVQAWPLEAVEKRLECNVTDIIVRCGNETNIFPHICPITHTDLERSKARPPARPGSPNVVICVIDGLSRAAFMSYFPKTIRFLEQSTDPAYGFKAIQFPNFHAMGFSTVENVPWLLFGPLDARTNEPRRSLFQRFQHRGYACAR